MQDVYDDDFRPHPPSHPVHTYVYDRRLHTTPPSHLVQDVDIKGREIIPRQVWQLRLLLRLSLQLGRHLGGGSEEVGMLDWYGVGMVLVWYWYGIGMVFGMVW